MRQIVKSWFAVLILVGLFLIGFSVNYAKDYVEFCDGNVSCILTLVNETSDYSLCDRAADVSGCYFRASYVFDDFLLCEKTNNVSGCFFDNAILGEDVSLCGLISDSRNLSELCVFSVAVKKRDVFVCDVSESPEYCYYSYAVHYNNVSVCDFSKKYKKACMNKILGSEVILD